MQSENQISHRYSSVFLQIKIQFYLNSTNSLDVRVAFGEHILNESRGTPPLVHPNLIC